ncbi:hypothetical protein C8R43DRAFT_960034 [Mycena crocata]|nr:hypothetical protein C8R43DRAFT_960034 [Mycena crocata]
MDRFYDKNAAGNALEAIASMRRQALASRSRSSIMHLADAAVEDLVVREMHEGRQNWRLCIKDSDDNVTDEVVLRVQGILTINNLVPTNVQACPTHKAMFLTQQAEVCGMGSRTFEDAMDNIATVVDRFAQHMGGGDVPNGSEREKHGQRFFSASNRIFTAQCDAPTEQDNEFEEGVDPFRLLAKFKNGKYIHAPENIVKYFRRVQSEEDKPGSYEGYYPGGFAVGDIVEMQVSFVAVVKGKEQAKMTTRLQALTLLDNKFSKQQMAKAERSKARARPVASPAVRRKVGYFAADEDEERQIKKKRTEGPGEDTQMDTIDGTEKWKSLRQRARMKGIT